MRHAARGGTAFTLHDCPVSLFKNNNTRKDACLCSVSNCRFCLPRAVPCRSLGSVRFPLRCASWTAVPCDLQDPSWADALLAAGFDPSKPTVWVAEGTLRGCRQPCGSACLLHAACEASTCLGGSQASKRHHPASYLVRGGLTLPLPCSKHSISCCLSQIGLIATAHT